MAFRFFSRQVIKAQTAGLRRAMQSKTQSFCTNSASPVLSPEHIRRNKQIANWLFFCSGTVFGMVVVGGITRLRKAGLSMAYWKPTSLLPPMTQQEWEEEFEFYKKFPEYHERNVGMTVQQFKPIYYWEYGHRMLGRAIGAFFGVPLAYFAMRRWITPGLYTRLGALFALGGAQGAVGWWMVKSGLEKHEKYSDGSFAEARVSPYRLATHLVSAFVIYAGMIWTGLTLRNPFPSAIAATPQLKRVRTLAKVCTALTATTVVSGAFVAGNEAGYCYNTFPDFEGKFIPDDIWEPLKPEWRNFFENKVTVQFDHRYLAISTLTAISGLAAVALKKGAPALPPRSASAIKAMTAMAYTQVALGISTLVLGVPIELAAVHQAGSVVLLTKALWTLHTLRVPPQSAAVILKIIAKAPK